jgi:hypothetical protein
MSVEVAVRPRQSPPRGPIIDADECRVHHKVEAMGLEPTNLLTASQALYQLSYAPSGGDRR